MGTIAIPLDLSRNVALERLELNVSLTNLPLVHEWVHRTLRTITSPTFCEFVICVLKGVYPSHQVSTHGWMDAGLSLDTLAARNPDFRVVVRGEFPPFIYGPWSDYDGPGSFFESYMPVVSLKDFVNYEYVPHVEDRLRGLSSL